MAKKNPYWQKIILIAFGVTLTFLVSELYLTYFAYQSVNQAWDCYQPDLKMHYTYLPGSHCPYKRFREYDNDPKINNVGLRSDQDTTLEKPKGVKRILIMGDSFVAAHELKEEQTFVELLEKELQIKQDNIEVLNGGIRGYSPLLNFFYLNFKALQFDPDIVLLFVNSGDFADDRKYLQYAKMNNNNQVVSIYPDWSFYDQRLDEKRLAARPKPKKKTFLSNIKILSPKEVWLKIKSSRTITLGRKGGKALLKKISGRPAWHEKMVLGDWLSDAFVIDREKIIREDKITLMKNTQSAVGSIGNLLDQNNINFYLVLFPFGHEVDQIEWDVGRVMWNFEPGKVYQPNSLIELGDWAQERGIKVINLVDELRQPHSERYYFRQDGHLTVAGHQAVSKILYSYSENFF